MDFPYLASVTALNVALAAELADAPPAPASVSIDGAVSSNTTIAWSPVKDAAAYRIYWRQGTKIIGRRGGRAQKDESRMSSPEAAPASSVRPDKRQPRQSRLVKGALACSRLGQFDVTI